MAFNQTLFRSPNRGGRMLSEYPDGDAPSLEQGGDGLVWEEFDTNYQINPAYVDTPDNKQKFLWSQYELGDLTQQTTDSGDVSISQTDPYSGSNCLFADVNPEGGLYAQLYTYDRDVFHWLYLKEVIYNELGFSGSWTNNLYNRMQFYIKTTPQLQTPLTGQFNGAIGTYLRATTASRGDQASNDASGTRMHYYHLINLPYLNGRWLKVVMDENPTHQQTENGNTEQPPISNPSNENLNMFDIMTRFYIDIGGQGNQYIVDDGSNTQWFLDKFTLYNESRQENETQVYTMCGGYDPLTNRLYVSWNRNKDENDTVHEVRYAFSDIHDIGWDAATVAPNGSVTRLGFQGYNCMVYDNSTISMGANTSIYVAVKPTDSTLFKQIQLDLT